MVNVASERRKTLDERFVGESMVDAKTIDGRPPGPILPIAMPRPPQIGENFTKVAELLGAVEGSAGAFDVEIVSARVQVSDQDEWQVAVVRRDLHALLEERHFL